MVLACGTTIQPAVARLSNTSEGVVSSAGQRSRIRSPSRRLRCKISYPPSPGPRFGRRSRHGCLRMSFPHWLVLPLSVPRVPPLLLGATEYGCELVIVSNSRPSPPSKERYKYALISGTLPCSLGFLDPAYCALQETIPKPNSQQYTTQGDTFSRSCHSFVYHFRHEGHHCPAVRHCGTCHPRHAWRCSHQLCEGQRQLLYGRRYHSALRQQCDWHARTLHSQPERISPGWRCGKLLAELGGGWRRRL
jgi:hypothetical protein